MTHQSQQIHGAQPSPSPQSTRTNQTTQATSTAPADQTSKGAQSSKSRSSATGQTGPKSMAGKRRSSMNALKSGIFVKTTVLPFEDERAYRRHLKDILASLSPEDALQSSLAQQIADSLWRGTRQELRACLHREEIFKKLTPSMLAGLIGIDDELAKQAPEFLLDPNWRFGAKNLKLYRALRGQFEHWRANAKGVANYQSVWRNYVDLFTHYANWLKPQISPELFMANQQGLNLAWQQNPKKLEEYLERYGARLWYLVHFEELRSRIRTWMASWYFLQGRHAKEVDQLDEVVLKERRLCQSFLDSYFKMRKSQVEHAFLRHSQLVIDKPNSMQGISMASTPDSK